ncbi:MAG: dual specificity protein phosphatase family protein [Nitriliruptorales bacterium]
MRLRRAVWHEVIPGLWQGGSRTSPEPARFDVVVSLCARGNRRAPLPPGQRCLTWFIADAAVPDEETIRRVARQVSAWLDEGQRVLVRCQAGLNRSGLVVARTLVERGFQPAEAIQLIRHRRHRRALNNQAFVAWLLKEGAGTRETAPAPSADPQP